MPLVEDQVRGNVILDSNGRAHAFADRQAALAAGASNEALFGLVTTTFLSHHADCPQGRAWRAPSPPAAARRDPAQGRLL